MMRRVTVAAVFLLLLARPGAGDVVERRGSEPALEGEITIINEAGVTIRSSLGAVHVVPWDRVRRVEGKVEDPTLDEKMAIAVDLWRSRSRVERGDTTLAEPLLERLFERYRGQTHETALVVAEGLLRCRLARADHVLAVVPALEVARLRRAQITTDTYSMLAPVFDEAMALCPRLAPAWIATPRLESLEQDLAAYQAQGDHVIVALAALYREAVRQALDRPPLPRPEPAPTHPGVELLGLLVECGADDADARRAARERLLRMIRSLPEWAEAWCRFQIGLSLLRDGGLGPLQQGTVNLVHLPARFSATQPYLVGLALARGAEAMDRAGDPDAAAVLRGQLQRTFPHHPVHETGLRRR